MDGVCLTVFHNGANSLTSLLLPQIHFFVSSSTVISSSGCFCHSIARQPHPEIDRTVISFSDVT